MNENNNKNENKLERNLRGKFPESFQRAGCWWGALKNVSFKWSQHSSQPHATDHTSFILGIHPWGCKHACSWVHGCIPSTAWKMSKYRVFPAPHFPVYGLNTVIYAANFRIQSKYKKIWTRKNCAVGYFSRSTTAKEFIPIPNNVSNLPQTNFSRASTKTLLKILLTQYFNSNERIKSRSN